MRGIKILLLVVAIAVPGAALAQRNFDDVEIRTVEVADGIYMLIGTGGNIGLSVGEDGAFLIDDQFAPLAGRIAAAVEQVSGGEVKFVLNTHWHGDHTGGNEIFGSAGAMIVAHENVRRRMDPGTFTDVMGSSGQAAAEALPVVTFSDQVTFWWNGERIDAQHVASAHTDGDTIVWFRDANVVHMGDNFFAASLPYIDVDSGGNVEGMIRAAEHVLAQADDETKIIPGHGGLAGVVQLRQYHEMLVTLRDRVQAQIDDGSSVEETIAAGVLGEYAELANSWMTAERFVGILYRSLSE
jgi:glyoxylase-like metal-dependent hydrolase (beta-lactamase superfamily II)